eukprot:IDg20076t1
MNRTLGNAGNLAVLSPTELGTVLKEIGVPSSYLRQNTRRAIVP